MTDVNLYSIKNAKRANIVSLFTSGSTLICCALPATLVAIGSVATLTSLVSSFPQLVWISEHKIIFFSLAAVMLILAGHLQWQARKATCPADPQLAGACIKARKNALLIYWVSVTVFIIGVFFAFIAPWFF